MSWKPDLRPLRNAVQRNLLLKLFSLVFAVGLWAFVNLGARDAEKTFQVPVELRAVPPELVVTSAMVDGIDVRVRGPRTLLGTIDEERLAIRLDLSKLRAGTTSFTIDPEMLSLPRGVRVTRLSPVDLPLTVERLVTRRVRVRAVIGTPVPDGYRMGEVEVRPASVTVTGPEGDVAKLDTLETAAVELPDAAGPFEGEAAVERPSALSRVVPDRVRVYGRLDEVVVSRDYPKVEIGVRNGADGATVTPVRVNVTLRGPERILGEFRPTEASLFVDIDGLAPGKHSRKIQARLPDGVEVTKIEPETVTVDIEAGAAREGGR